MSHRYGLQVGPPVQASASRLTNGTTSMRQDMLRKTAHSFGLKTLTSCISKDYLRTDHNHLHCHS